MTFGLSLLAVLAACGGMAAQPSVEGTGFRGVSLGWFATPATRIEVDFALTDPRPQMRVFGADHEASGLCASLYVNSSGRFSFGAGDKFQAHPTEIVADTRRFICCETVGWLNWSAPLSASGKQGYLHFAELKDGKFADISVRNGYRVRKERW